MEHAVVEARRLERAVQYVNRLRRSRARDERRARLALVEDVADVLLGASGRLAVYGSLAPGEKNHDWIADLPGTWQEGFVHGHLVDRGWSRRRGYPTLRLGRRSAPQVPVKLFVSARLSGHWDRLDALEGSRYRRVLTLVFGATAAVTVANVYEERR